MTIIKLIFNLHLICLSFYNYILSFAVTGSLIIKNKHACQYKHINHVTCC